MTLQLDEPGTAYCQRLSTFSKTSNQTTSHVSEFQMFQALQLAFKPTSVQFINMISHDFDTLLGVDGFCMVLSDCFGLTFQLWLQVLHIKWILVSMQPSLMSLQHRVVLSGCVPFVFAQLFMRYLCFRGFICWHVDGFSASILFQLRCIE